MPSVLQSRVGFGAICLLGAGTSTQSVLARGPWTAGQAQGRRRRVVMTTVVWQDHQAPPPGSPTRLWPLHAFLCKGYLYSLHHILSGPSIFSRIFSNIENILTSRRSTETKSRSKPAQNLQNLKISVGIDPKPTVEGGIAVSSSLVKTVLDAAQRQRQEYSRISLDSRSTKVKGCGKLVYS